MLFRSASTGGQNRAWRVTACVSVGLPRPADRRARATQRARSRGRCRARARDAEPTVRDEIADWARDQARTAPAQGVESHPDDVPLPRSEPLARAPSLNAICTVSTRTQHKVATRTRDSLQAAQVAFQASCQPCGARMPSCARCAIMPRRTLGRYCHRLASDTRASTRLSGCRALATQA